MQANRWTATCYVLQFKVHELHPIVISKYANSSITGEHEQWYLRSVSLKYYSETATTHLIIKKLSHHIESNRLQHEGLIHSLPSGGLDHCIAASTKLPQTGTPPQQVEGGAVEQHSFSLQTSNCTSRPETV